MGQRSLHGRSSPELEQLRAHLSALHMGEGSFRFAHRKQTEIKTIWEPQSFRVTAAGGS